MFRATLAALCATALLGTSVSAEVVMDQNFDDTDTFSPGIDGFLGDATTTGGRWGDFNSTSGAFITDSLSVSGNQAMTVRRDGNLPIGRVDDGITEDEFEISYWLYRHASDSSIIIQTGNGSVSSQVELGVFINGGVIYVRNDTNSSWITTNYGIAAEEWTRLRQHVVVTNDGASFDLYRTQGTGGTEQHLGNFEIPSVPVDIDRIRFNPQGNSGNLTSFDDILVTQVPEPASFGLMLAGGAMMLLRKQRHV